MATRAELLGILRGRYASAPRPEPGLILDEFVAVSGYHRKHAIRLLRQPASTGNRRGRSPVYAAAVKAALVLVWEASDRICGKRLKALRWTAYCARREARAAPGAVAGRA